MELRKKRESQPRWYDVSLANRTSSRQSLYELLLYLLSLIICLPIITMFLQARVKVQKSTVTTLTNPVQRRKTNIKSARHHRARASFNQKGSCSTKKIICKP